MATIHRYTSLPSTMTTAAELADSGAAAGTIVVAEEQTAGQGRLGRSWHSEPRSGLYATFILRPTLAPDTLPVVTLAIGLAVREAIAEVCGIECDLRWPNDVLLNDRKCAGVLVQLHSKAVLAGIGINVNQAGFPDDIASLATSLRLVAGREWSRDDLLAALAGAVDRQVEMLATFGRNAVLDSFQNVSSYVRGRRVVVEAPEGNLRGTTDGLDAQGFLWLLQDDGKRRLILAGGVRPE